jgi:hypothetical protein
MATERSLYGFALTTLLLGLIFSAMLLLVGFLTRVLGDSRTRAALIVACISPIVAALLYFVAFGRYLDGGTTFLGGYPLVEDGSVTRFGVAFVFFYTIAITSSLVIVKVGKRND